MEIIVQVPPADKPGPQVVDKSLTTADALLERGRYEINNAADAVIETGKIHALQFVAPNTVVNIERLGEENVSIVTDFEIKISMGKKPTAYSMVKSVRGKE